MNIMKTKILRMNISIKKSCFHAFELERRAILLNKKTNEQAQAPWNTLEHDSTAIIVNMIAPPDANNTFVASKNKIVYA